MNKLLIVILLAFTTVFAGADLFDDIQKVRVFQLADAYYQVGVRYTELGKKALGENLKAQALILFPGYLDPSKHPKTAKPAADTQDLNPPVTSIAITTDGTAPAVLPLAGTQVTTNPEELNRPQVRTNAIKGDKIVKLQVSALLRGFINQDTSLITRVLAPTLTISGQKLTQDDVASQTAAFFQKNDTTLYGPSSLLNLETLKIQSIPGTSDYTATVDTATGTDLSGILPFWKPQLVLTFVREADLWKLSAVN